MKATIYTTTTCAYCPMVKKWLKMKNISYDEINIDEHPEKRQEAADISGAYTVPITVVGSTVVIGWKPLELAKAIA